MLHSRRHCICLHVVDMLLLCCEAFGIFKGFPHAEDYDENIAACPGLTQMGVSACLCMLCVLPKMRHQTLTGMFGSAIGSLKYELSNCSYQCYCFFFLFSKNGSHLQPLKHCSILRTLFYPKLNPEAILVGSCSSGTIGTKIMSSDPSMFIDPPKC